MVGGSLQVLRLVIKKYNIESGGIFFRIFFSETTRLYFLKETRLERFCENDSPKSKFFCVHQKLKNKQLLT
jgi:hypothetical protein